MDIQAFLETINQARKASSANLTIGSMLEKLNQFEDSTPVTFTNGKHFEGGYDSYRGYYEDLYIEWGDEDKGLDTVGELKKVLNKALRNGVMHGYKGGDYSITPDTLVWFSTYGSCGDMIVDIQNLNDSVFVITKEDEF